MALGSVSPSLLPEPQAGGSIDPQQQDVRADSDEVAAQDLLGQARHAQEAHVPFDVEQVQTTVRRDGESSCSEEARPGEALSGREVQDGAHAARLLDLQQADPGPVTPQQQEPLLKHQIP